MKALLPLYLMIASPMASADTPATHCGKFSPRDEVSTPLTVAEIERQEMADLSERRKIRSDIPNLPFGFINADWKAFKSQFRPGDTLVRYSTDKRSWQHLAGETGIALMRSGCVVATFVTMYN